MEKKIAGLLGAMAALGAFNAAEAAPTPSPTPTDALRANSFADLLEPIPNAAALLKAQGGSMIAYRQLTIVDGQGRTAAFSGDKTLGRHASAHGSGVVAAGNMLANTDVPTAMVAIPVSLRMRSERKNDTQLYLILLKFHTDGNSLIRLFRIKTSS